MPLKIPKIKPNILFNKNVLDLFKLLNINLKNIELSKNIIKNGIKKETTFNIISLLMKFAKIVWNSSRKVKVINNDNNHIRVLTISFKKPL